MLTWRRRKIADALWVWRRSPEVCSRRLVACRVGGCVLCISGHRGAMICRWPCLRAMLALTAFIHARRPNPASPSTKRKCFLVIGQATAASGRANLTLRNLSDRTCQNTTKVKFSLSTTLFLDLSGGVRGVDSMVYEECFRGTRRNCNSAGINICRETLQRTRAATYVTFPRLYPGHTTTRLTCMYRPGLRIITRHERMGAPRMSS